MTDERIELSEESHAVLDRKQQLLLDNLSDRPEVSVTYFVPDERKSGGAYVTVTGQVKKVDEFERLLIFTDGTKIPLDEVLDINGYLFQCLEKEGY